MWKIICMLLIIFLKGKEGWQVEFYIFLVLQPIVIGDYYYSSLFLVVSPLDTTVFFPCVNLQIYRVDS
jgi:hypothetical protein